MLRMAGSAFVLAVVGIVVLHLVLGMAGGLIGLLFGVAWLLFKAMLALTLLYFVLSVVAPDAARKMRGIVSGPPQV